MIPKEQEALQILRDALDTDPSERESFLSARCQGNTALRERVQAMLARIALAERHGVDDDAWQTLDTLGESASAHSQNPDDALIGSLLGPFRVAERIGRGGMGIVYRGVREGSDFTQAVAIKLIRRGYDFDDVHARFLRERRILARLSHPNLARFIDGGVAAEGRPWFALEFVRGESITRWCDTQRLSVRQRMKLFLDVCAAVQYAHTRLIVHRDLKPGNVLVDDSGAVRLLDFGVAGLLAGDPDEGDSPTTISDRHAMTPEYAAPEQFAGGVVGIPADVYALGVLAYELVAGVLPYALDRTDPEAAARTVAQTPPQALASAISRVEADTSSSVDLRLAARKTGLRGYRRLVRGDLTRILEKALAKEPERRYETVQAFADDLTRWLGGAPVRVTANRFGYRFGKFVQRNRVAVAFASLAFLLLVAGVGGVLWKSREALREAERATAVKTFLLSLFDNNTPGVSTDDVPSTRDLLARGVEKIQGEMADQPDLRAEMLTTLGRIHNQLALYDAAEPLLRQALTLESAGSGASALKRADTLRELAQVLVEKSQFPEAEKLLREGLADIDGRDLAREARLHQVLGRALASDNQIEEGVLESENAVAQFRRVEVPPGARLADALGDLGATLMQQGKFEQSLVPQREALEIQRRIHQGAHADIAVVASNIVVAFLNLGRYEDAVPLIEEAIAVDRKVYAGPHRALAVHLTNLGAVLSLLYRTDEAVDAWREGLEIRTKLYGADNPETAKSALNLVNALSLAEKYPEAETVLRGAIAVFTGAQGEWRIWLSMCQNNLANVLMKQGRPDGARTAINQAIALREQ
ncbi:MAG: serine/threonine-protein kinase, partial [Dokdonella sp.]